MGIEPGIILAVLRSGACQGLLFKSLGAGNVPSEGEYSILPIIREAINTFNVPVLRYDIIAMVGVFILSLFVVSLQSCGFWV